MEDFMKTFSKITKLKFKDKFGRIESYRIVEITTEQGISYGIYLEVGAKDYLRYSTESLDDLNRQYQSILRQAKQDGKRYYVCRIL